MPPSGSEIVWPTVEYKARTLRTMVEPHQFESEENVTSKAIQVFPLVVYYEYQVESHGFMCGGSGYSYWWFGELKFSPTSMFIT
jgi:hypothetical protein